jgi:cell division transport system permease protein
MSVRALRYAFDEAVSSLWRGRQSGLLSMATIAIALFVLGAFLLVTANLERLSDEWSRAAEMSVYLTDEVTPAERGAVEKLLQPGNGAIVASVEYVSKEAALARFKQTFADLAAAADTLDSNPLPASYEIRLNAGSATREAVDRLAGLLRETPGVADVRYDREWLDRLRAMVAVLGRLGLALGAILTIAAALTVANVVRLALHARRDEIEIMQLVGAPQSFIRGPFVMEGVLQGGIGGALALAALAAAFLALRGRYLLPLARAANLQSVGFLPLELCLLLVVGGMLVGCLGGLVAARVRA